jgi:hypothetical protein
MSDIVASRIRVQACVGSITVEFANSSGAFGSELPVSVLAVSDTISRASAQEKLRSCDESL